MNFPSIKTFDSGSKRNKRYLHNHYPEFEEYLSVHFNFVDKWSEKLYCYYHNIHSLPTCSMCGGFLRFINFNKGYNKYCSIKCSSNSTATINKRKKTCLEKYGVENPFQSDIIKDKIKETNLEKYGVENPFQSQEVQNKYKQTCLEKYGVEYPFQSDIIKDKIKETNFEKYGKEHYNNRDKAKQSCLEKYGIENPFQSQEAQNKYKQTCLEKYGVEYASQSEKFRNNFKQTCLEKYGVENPFQSKDVQNKYKQTCLEKYGVENPSQSKEIQNKTKQTCLEKYGSEYYAQSQDYQSRQKDILNRYKQTCLERYGVKNPFQSKSIKDKTKETNLEKYGSEYYTQSEEFQSRHDEIQTKINNTKHQNHTFSSSQIETEFATYLDSKNIEYKRQYRSKEYPFNCDFYLPKYDLYIEIQGSWTHGGHPYNEETDKDILESWKSKNTDYYNNAIETWTIRDVNKRNIAKQNHLKYLEIFSDKLDVVIKNLNTVLKHLL